MQCVGALNSTSPSIDINSTVLLPLSGYRSSIKQSVVQQDAAEGETQHTIGMTCQYGRTALAGHVARERLAERVNVLPL